jgi:Mn-dependent DtxR family transcriptional regulator
MNTNETRVFDWFTTHADEDGLVTTSCPSIANELGIACRTVQGILQRLESRGEVYLIDYRRFAVVKIALAE